MFQRAENELQIGLDIRHAVIVAGLSQKLATIVRFLDGSKSLSSLLARMSSTQAGQLRHLLGQLNARGLVSDAVRERDAKHLRTDTAFWALRAGENHDTLSERCAHTSITVHGDGALLSAVATGLAANGIGHIDVESPGTVTTADAGNGYRHTDVGRNRRAAVIDAVHEVNPATATHTVSSNRHPDLVVVTDALVPDPPLVQRLMCERIPHLAVRVRESVGIVGPFVIPGRTSCLNCADLHRAERDQRWPRVANQLAAGGQRAGTASTYATAALAVSQAIRALHASPGPCPTWNTTLELDMFHPTVQFRHWSAHPRCGCQARS